MRVRSAGWPNVLLAGLSLSESMYGPHVLVCVRARGAFPKKKKKKNLLATATRAGEFTVFTIHRLLFTQITIHSLYFAVVPALARCGPPLEASVVSKTTSMCVMTNSPQ
jgi:hypothetical protein